MFFLHNCDDDRFKQIQTCFRLKDYLLKDSRDVMVTSFMVISMIIKPSTLSFYDQNSRLSELGCNVVDIRTEVSH